MRWWFSIEFLPKQSVSGFVFADPHHQFIFVGFTQGHKLQWEVYIHRWFMVLGELTDLFGNPRFQFYTWDPHFWSLKFSLVKIAPFHAVKKFKSSVVQTKKERGAIYPRVIIIKRGLLKNPPFSWMIFPAINLHITIFFSQPHLMERTPQCLGRSTHHSPNFLP